MPVFIVVIGAGNRGKTKAINRAYQLVSKSNEQVGGNISRTCNYRNKTIAFVSGGDNKHEVSKNEEHLTESDIIVCACRPYNRTREQIMEYADDQIIYWISKVWTEEELHDRHIDEAVTHIIALINAHCCNPPSTSVI